MIYVCVDYLTARAGLHSSLRCPLVPATPGDGQRWIRITRATFAGELPRFEQHEHRFAAEARLNDMWLEIVFGDLAFERAVGAYLLGVMGRH